MKKILIYGTITIIAVVFIFMKLNANKKENKSQTDIVKQSSNLDVPVKVEKAERTAFANNFLANGNFEPIRELAFNSETTGSITKLLVTEGSHVSQGQVLARIDDELLNATLKSTQASLDQLKVDIARYESSYKTGGVTQKQIDDLKLQYKQMEANLTSARRRVKDTYVKAPISGVINKKYVEQGTYLALGTKMFDIVDVSTLKLVVAVPEAQVIALHNGQDINITSNVFPEINYKGKISFIAAKGDNSLNYPVEIHVANIGGKQLKAGMYGTAHFDIAGAKQQPLMLVARTSFINGVNSNTVYVVENGKAKLRKVIAGKVMGDRVEIREGLKEGETVITNGQLNLADGVKVVVQDK